MVEIILARHPETLGNNRHQLIGCEDIALSEKGKKQQRILCEHIKNNISNKNLPVNVYTSPLQRCAMPAALFRHTLVEFKQGEYHVESSLIERNFGTLQYKTKKEIMEEFKKYKTFDELLKQELGLFEYTNEVRWRVNTVLEKILKSENTTNIIFSHSSILRSMISILLKHDEQEFEQIHRTGPRNCEIWKWNSEEANLMIRNALLLE